LTLTASLSTISVKEIFLESFNNLSVKVSSGFIFYFLIIYEFSSIVEGLWISCIEES